MLEPAQIFPNPNAGFFWLETNSPVSDLRVINIAGQEIDIRVEMANSQRLRISTGKAVPGFYLLQWVEEDQLRTRPLVIGE